MVFLACLQQHATNSPPHATLAKHRGMRAEDRLTPMTTLGRYSPNVPREGNREQQEQ
jgi:hypothetical protein